MPFTPAPPVQLRSPTGRRFLMGREAVAMGTLAAGGALNPIFQESFKGIDLSPQRDIYEAAEWEGAASDIIGLDEETHYEQFTVHVPFRVDGAGGWGGMSLLGMINDSVAAGGTVNVNALPTSAAISNGTVTVGFSTPHGIPSSVAAITTTNFSPAAYNATFTSATDGLVILNPYTIQWSLFATAGAGTALPTRTGTGPYTVTYTATAHGLTNGQLVKITNVTSGGPGTYNGTVTISGVTANTFQYTVSTDPGVASTNGNFAGPFATQPTLAGNSNVAASYSIGGNLHGPLQPNAISNLCNTFSMWYVLSEIGQGDTTPNYTRCWGYVQIASIHVTFAANGDLACDLECWCKWPTRTAPPVPDLYIPGDVTMKGTRTMGYQGAFTLYGQSGVAYTARVLSGDVTIARPLEAVFSSDQQTIIAIQPGPLTYTGNLNFNFDSYAPGTVAGDFHDFKPTGDATHANTIRWTDSDLNYWEIQSWPWKWTGLTYDHSGQYVKANGSFRAYNDKTYANAASPRLTKIWQMSLQNNFSHPMITT